MKPNYIYIYICIYIFTHKRKMLNANASVLSFTDFCWSLLFLVSIRSVRYPTKAACVCGKTDIINRTHRKSCVCE